MNLEIHTIVSMPFAENTYIAWLRGRTDCLVIDPGLEPDAILDFLNERSLTVSAILNTHGHGDHIAGNASMKEAFPDSPLIIGLRDAPLLTDPVLNVSRPFGFDILSPVADRLVNEDEILEFAGIRLLVKEIPGHSPGHVVFIVAGMPTIVFGGDVLFRGSIGRTDFPGGSLQTLLTGIRNKLWPLADDTIVYPGHGPTTKIGHEKRTNPFLDS